MSNEEEEFTVACVDSGFDVAPIDPLKNVIQTWVLENAKNLMPRSLAHGRVSASLPQSRAPILGPWAGLCQSASVSCPDPWPMGGSLPVCLSLVPRSLAHGRVSASLPQSRAPILGPWAGLCQSASVSCPDPWPMGGSLPVCLSLVPRSLAHGRVSASLPQSRAPILGPWAGLCQSASVSCPDPWPMGGSLSVCLSLVPRSLAHGRVSASLPQSRAPILGPWAGLCQSASVSCPDPWPMGGSLSVCLSLVPRSLAHGRVSASLPQSRAPILGPWAGLCQSASVSCPDPWPMGGSLPVCLSLVL